MPLRPPPLARAARIAPFHRPSSSPYARILTQTSPFHTTAPRAAEPSTQTHYEVLHLPPSASPAEIKGQFYTLSKQHHPDHNKDDPTASTRFVAISEAYHVLSVPEKRAQYDAQLSAHAGPRSPWGHATHRHPQGSYSSASFAGSRPATGLNKKRGTFRGPPPSFYKAGGYGKHGAKRTEHAHHETASGEAEGEAESDGDFGGFGPGQTSQGRQVPHFDDVRHKVTHDHVHEHIHGRRKARARKAARDELVGGGLVFNFVIVSGVLALAGMTTVWFGNSGSGEKARKEKDDTA